MSNSPLVSYVKLSPNHSGKRTHAIDRITPHCVVGQCSVETLGNIFASPSRQASSNYGIGVDGRVGMYVDEENRSWCTASNANDQRAVTIECASDASHPYAFKDIVYNKLIELCVDICKRNRKTKLLWFGDKDKTLTYTPAANEMVLTVHRWFANKSCPGDWMYARMGDLAAEVTKRLTPEPIPSFTPYTVKVNITDLNIYSGPGTNYNVVGQTGKGVFTIVEEASGTGATKWGKLKSGAGWVSLDLIESTKPVVDNVIKLGDAVTFKGGEYYVSSTGGKHYTGKPGSARVTNIVHGAPFPYHVIRTSKNTTVYGWVKADLISK